MQLIFKKEDGLIPVIIQHSKTLKILMLGYMNETAFNKTREEGIVTFYSRSKKRLWTKGETSGNFLTVDAMTHDCDRDALLILVTPKGPACHTGSTSCFSADYSSGFLFELEQIINLKVLLNDPESYTNTLYKKGINKIAQKVGEEALELVIEAKDNNLELFQNEAADLLFHFLLLLRAKNTNLKAIEKILYNRQHKMSINKTINNH
jgi:phosphoribosyl-AMP cyclohydrolase / phosphoribosyl-ATP pyrophosphohydrolase